VNSQVGIDPVEGGVTLNIYPNPTANGQTTVSVNGMISGEWTLRVLDISGKQLLQKQFNANGGTFNYALDLSGLPAGTYLVRFTHNEYSFLRRLVVSGNH
jgi:hypothetical protein